MINPVQLRQYVIRPVLQKLGLPNTETAEELLILTACIESRCGYYLHQIKGPALGIYQMEPVTHEDIHVNFLRHKPDLQLAVGDLCRSFSSKELVWNLAYATAMTRIHYFRVKSPLPDAKDIKGLAQYWKHHYNTLLGRGNVDDALDAYFEFVK